MAPWRHCAGVAPRFAPAPCLGGKLSQTLARNLTRVIGSHSFHVRTRTSSHRGIFCLLSTPIHGLGIASSRQTIRRLSPSSPSASHRDSCPSPARCLSPTKAGGLVSRLGSWHALRTTCPSLGVASRLCGIHGPRQLHCEPSRRTQPDKAKVLPPRMRLPRTC